MMRILGIAIHAPINAGLKPSMKWFKHFTRAHEDRAIERLIMEFGLVGYGLYFYCIEIIAGSLEVDNITFGLEPDAEILARRLQTDKETVEAIMRRCVDLRLFEVAENGRITCLKIGKFFDQTMTSNPGMRSLFAKYHHVKYQNSDKVGLNSDKIMIHSDQIRLDEIRLDKNNIRGPDKPAASKFSKPSIEEVRTYCAERKNHVDPERFIDHYESNGWRVGKTPMKSWKAAVRTWERSEYQPEIAPKQAVAGRSDAWTAEDIARQQEAIENRALPTSEEIEELERIKAKALGSGPGRLLAAVWGDHEGAT